MKRVLYILICAITFASCSPWDIYDNDPVDEPDNTAPKIIGEWAWISSSGGIAGITVEQKDYPNILTIKFDNERFYNFRDREIIQSGLYSLVYMVNSPLGDSCWILNTKTEYRNPEYFTNYSYDDDTPVRINIEGKKLWIIYPCCDMFNSVFCRK